MKQCITHSFACDCREEKFRKIEKENAELELDLKKAKSGFFRDQEYIRVINKENAILLEAVNEIKKHQEIVLPVDDRMRKLSTTWRLCFEALEKIEQLNKGEK